MTMAADLQPPSICEFLRTMLTTAPRENSIVAPAPSCTSSLVAASDTWTETPKRTSKDGKAETPQLEALADPLINLLGGGFNYFLFSPLPGDPILTHIFQRG